MQNKLCKRIIPCLDVKDGRVVKGVNFVSLIDAGDIVENARYYNDEGADELVFLDITASHEGRKTFASLVERAARELFIPLTVGGGISSVEDFRTLLLAGADKISVNSAAVRDKTLLSRAADRFGSQCVVCAIDAKRTVNGYSVFLNGGRIDTGHRRRRVGGRGRALRRGRTAGHLDGRRRHQSRVRQRTDRADFLARAYPRHRLGRRRNDGALCRDLPRGCGRGVGCFSVPLPRNAHLRSEALSCRTGGACAVMTDLNRFFEKSELIPAIVQDASTGEVLMLAYMNAESLRLTLETRKCTFFSRSRGRLWTKGETSGHFMNVVEIFYDCDCDTLLVKANPAGPACHTGNRTCFYRRLDENDCTERENEI